MLSQGCRAGSSEAGDPLGDIPHFTDEEAKPRWSSILRGSHSWLPTGCSGEAHAAHLKAEEFRLERKGFLHKGRLERPGAGSCYTVFSVSF